MSLMTLFPSSLIFQVTCVPYFPSQTMCLIHFVSPLPHSSEHVSGLTTELVSKCVNELFQKIVRLSVRFIQGKTTSTFTLFCSLASSLHFLFPNLLFGLCWETVNYLPRSALSFPCVCACVWARAHYISDTSINLALLEQVHRSLKGTQTLFLMISNGGSSYHQFSVSVPGLQ